MIIGHWMVLGQNLAYNTNLWLPHIFINRNSFKFLHHSLYILGETVIAGIWQQQISLALFHPLVIKLLCLSLLQLVWHGAVFHIHQHITIYSCLNGICQAGPGELKGICLKSPAGKYWNLRIASIL